MIEPTPDEIIKVDPHADKIACDGGGGVLGHPRVWYSFDSADSVECEYCDRIYTKTGKTA